MAISSERAAPPRVLLLSGTSEGPRLARGLLEAGFAVTATVTRPEARENLFATLLDELTVEVGGFSEPALADYLKAGMADIVLDATHPFAARITLLAHRVCRQVGTPYVRFERPDWTPPAETRFADSFAEAAQMLPALGQRILLTLGARQLKHFAHLHEELELFARILPAPQSLAQAIEAGFSDEQVICMRPPFSQACNRALFEEYRIDALVTKDSGAEGGVVEKVAAAMELGIQVLMVRRPVLDGIVAVRTVAEALAACRQLRDATSLGRSTNP